MDTDVSKVHSNEAILQVKMAYLLPRAYAVFFGRFIITESLDGGLVFTIH